MTIRAFIALELPDIIQESIIKQTARLHQSLGQALVRWTPAKNMHLTLKFLGDVPPTHLDFLKQSISQSANSSTAFDLQLSGIGAFPNPKLARILWVGIHTSVPLNVLQQNIENSMAKLGYKKEERSFSPHLTLGRVRQNLSSSDNLKIRDVLQTIQLGNIGTARVHSVHLFNSELTPTGSEYTKLFSANFKQ